MAYYNLNKIGQTDVSLTELYKVKGINLDQDRNSDYHQTSYASATSGSQLGPGLNPWQSYTADINGQTTTEQLGMIGFNQKYAWNSGTFLPEVRLSNLRGYDWKYHPGTWGTRGDAGVDSGLGTNTTNVVSIQSNMQRPGWNQGKYNHLYCYAGADPSSSTGVPIYWNWIHHWITADLLNDGTRYLTLSAGRVQANGTGNQATIGDPVHTTTESVLGTNAQLVPLNIGQGEGQPYNELLKMGGTNQFVLHYRNNSAQNKARVVTVNQSYQTTPTISIGAEQSPTNNGNPVFAHGGVNMGIGSGWAGFHRGASYQRIQYVNWISGTTFNTLSSYLVANRSSSNTLYPGWMIKLSDELAMWFYPRRSGNTSGSARMIAASVFETSGTAKTPVLRGTVDLATFDIGSISTETCTASVGSSDTEGTLWGIVVWSENSSGANATQIMSWKYVVSTNSLTFQTGTILSVSNSASGTNTYRMHTSIKCLGYNDGVITENSPKNYYEVLIPLGNSTGGGISRVIVEQVATASGTGVMVEKSFQGPTATEFGTTARVMGTHTFMNYPGGRNWPFSALFRGYSWTTWSLYPWSDSSNVVKIMGTEWETTLNNP